MDVNDDVQAVSKSSQSPLQESVHHLRGRIDKTYATPDCPHVLSSISNQETGYDRRWSNGECHGEQSDTSHDRAHSLDSLVVQWHVVQTTPKEKAI